MYKESYHICPLCDTINSWNFICKKRKSHFKKKTNWKIYHKTTQIYQKTKSIFHHLNKVKTRTNWNNNEIQSNFFFCFQKLKAKKFKLKKPRNSRLKNRAVHYLLKWISPYPQKTLKFKFRKWGGSMSGLIFFLLNKKLKK